MVMWSAYQIERDVHWKPHSSILSETLRNYEEHEEHDEEHDEKLS